MLAYILEITRRGNKRITNRGSFEGLQIGARAITNRDSLRDFKSGQKDYKSKQGFQIGAKRFKSGKGLQIGAEHHKAPVVEPTVSKVADIAEMALGLLQNLRWSAL